MKIREEEKKERLLASVTAFSTHACLCLDIGGWKLLHLATWWR